MSEQDTREQLEADIERYLSQAGCHEMVCGWLDRQAAITRYIERGMHDFILDRLERENDKLTAERDELQAAIDAMGNGQFYAMYEELRAEVDNLRKRNGNQADTIKRLRAEFDVALDDLARAVEDKRSHPF